MLARPPPLWPRCARCFWVAGVINATSPCFLGRSCETLFLSNPPEGHRGWFATPHRRKSSEFPSHLLVCYRRQLQAAKSFARAGSDHQSTVDQRLQRSGRGHDRISAQSDHIACLTGAPRHGSLKELLEYCAPRWINRDTANICGSVRIWPSANIGPQSAPPDVRTLCGIAMRQSRLR
jgi:hypothetical protein